MKPGDGSPAGLPEVVAVGPRRLTLGLDRYASLDLHIHQQIHPTLRPHDLNQLHRLAIEAELTGRGGAGFPFAAKLAAVARSVRRSGADPIVVVNGIEGEPASAKDKTLIARAPHLVLDGAALAAHALGARAVVLAISDAHPGAAAAAAALDQRWMPASTRLVRVPHRFIAGESGALVRAINGDTPVPPGSKVLASDAGVGGAPTLLSNAETFAQLAVAARLGPHRYVSVGDPGEPGTVLLTVTGSASRPAVVECPTGTPLGEILRVCRAPAGPGVLVGGFHGRWIPARAARAAAVSRSGLAAVGGTLGAGVVVPLGDGTCPLGEAARVVRYLADQSASQCGPCRGGLPALAAAMDALLHGTGDPLTVRAATAAVRGRGACHHPDGTARFAASCLDAFPDDVAAHRAGRGCGRPVRGVLPVPSPRVAGSRRLRVDRTRCEGHGRCAHVAPDLIRLAADGYPAVPDGDLPATLENTGRRAVSTCPALALRLDG